MTRGLTWSAVVFAVLAVAVLPGCSLKEDYKAEVRGYLQHTESLTRSYVYAETRPGGARAEIAVKVADDLAYSADYTLNGNPEMSEVVRDDARALRISDPALLQGLVAPPVPPGPSPAPAGAPSPAPSPSPSPSASPAPRSGAGSVQFSATAPIAVLAALRSGQWVLDPSGASALQRVIPRGPLPQIGQNPVADALDVLNYVDQNLVGINSDQVVKFNPEAGGYYRDLDPFPWPGPGVTRYDINASPQLPAPGALQNANDAQGLLLNFVKYFRTDSVYVRSGVVVAVRESIDVQRRLKLPDQDIVALMQNALGQTPGFNHVRLPAGLASKPLGVQEQVIVALLNLFYSSQGTQLLRERQLDVEFTYGGSPQVVLPPTDQRGSLGGILNRGQILGGPGV